MTSSPPREFDAIIVGQGLAGMTLAWSLRWLGWRVLSVDRDEAVTTSKIAAGLITPVTGQRIAVSWRVAELLPAARAFYRRVEALTGKSFFHERRALRLFASDDERRRWNTKQHLPEIRAHLTEPQPARLADPREVETSGGGFEMAAAQLDVANFLLASRRAFSADGGWQTADVQVGTEVHPEVGGVRFTGDIQAFARYAIFCQGYAGSQHPLFSWVPFKAARGDILTLELRHFQERRGLHRGVWLAPAPGGLFRAGSTYDWHQLDTTPSTLGREEVLNRLREFVTAEIRVVAHHAAVRPIIRESKAVLGLHPVWDRVGYFNGLGSKGSLHAPFFAAQFAAHLAGQGEIDGAVDLRKNF